MQILNKSRKQIKIFREPIVRKLIFLAVIFFIFLFLIIIVDQAAYLAIDRNNNLIENEREKRKLGQIIIRNLISIEKNIYEIFFSQKNQAEFPLINDKLNKSINDIKAILAVLQNGGGFTDIIPVNFLNINEIEEKIIYVKDRTMGYEISVIDLTPKIMDIENLAGQAAKLVDEKRNCSGLKACALAENKISQHLKYLETYLQRSKESANKIYYDSHQEILRLEKERIRSRSEYNFYILILASSVILASLFFILIIISQIIKIIKKRNKAEKELKWLNKELQRAQKEIKKYSQNLEKQIKARTEELEGALKKLKNDKKEIDKQRLATLNILEDVHESQDELKEAYTILEKRSEELSALKSLSEELTSVLEIEEAIKIVNRYIVDVLDCSVIAYLVFNPAEESGLVYLSYLNKEVSDKFLDIMKKNMLGFIAEKKESNLDSAGKLVRNVEPRNLGVKINNQNPAVLKSDLLIPLKVGGHILGLMHLGSADFNLKNSAKQGLIDAIAITFSLSIDRLHSLISAQHSKTVSLVASLTDGVIMFNNNKEIVLINPAFKKYTGLTVKDLSLEDFYSSFEEVGIEKMITDALDSNRLSHVNEISLGKKYFDIFITPVKDNQHRIVGGAIILHDITHLKEIDRMKTEFVSVASHQLRTPLTAIKLFTDMLARGEVGKLNKEQKEYLDNVSQSTERMVRLVNDLLNVTRIESGRLKVETQKIDIKKFLKSIISEAKPLAQSRGEVITFNDNNIQLSHIPLDQNLMRQVIHNLIINSIRYSLKNKGKIIVSLEKKDNENFIIKVADNGIGIPEANQARMFEKFYRADNAIKAITEGTGLGLYVAKMIVEQSGGKIWFTSKKDKGATFYVQLPIVGMKNQEGEKGLAIS